MRDELWIPDGMKDLPVDRVGPRQRLTEALDEIFAVPVNRADNLDAVESKLFGIGSESYVVGSHEYYLGYAITRKKLLCLDTGHFHPTETIVDKISAVFTHLDEILLHVSRGIRWDSDHVVIVDDSLLAIAQELVRGNFLERTHIGLDYFDASINRVAAWVIGARAMLKALLIALLEPIHVAPRPGEGRRLHGAAGAAGRAEDLALRGRLGLLLPEAERARRPGLDRRSEAVREGRVVEAEVIEISRCSCELAAIERNRS